MRPAAPRDSAKLLTVAGSHLGDHLVSDLPDLLDPGDCLVFNDTRVIPTQLEGVRYRDGSTARISATLHTRLSENRWAAFVKGAKRLVVGDKVRFGDCQEGCMSECLEGNVMDKSLSGDVTLEFGVSGTSLLEAIHSTGAMPLPPYIASRRQVDQQDDQDYQTVYAKTSGAVAAPTAGLHFTPELLQRLDDRCVQKQFVTLHVGPGTFLPVKVDETRQHKMHSEWGEITTDVAAKLNETKNRGGRIVSVGTTSLRLLESAADGRGRIQPWRGETDIFITPGYRFKAVDMLMTNFHLPRSTLFMLVCAFAGIQTMKNAYSHAIASGYRFYSYGDTSLLHRAS